ncbi:MAG: autotransporter-associated beta strand repeat-containing protein [Tepidisphaeraceae bacterium]
MKIDRRTKSKWPTNATLASVALVTVASSAHAALSFNVGGTWDTDARKNAAIAALTAVTNRYNAYGDFGNYNVYAYYNSGIPTAQASYLGSIGYGGTYPNERVTAHELAHYLGSGTYGTPWNGERGEALIDQFDGIEATLNGDTQHFWPYGLNYDSEWSDINALRQVAVMYAQRADMGIGSTANPAAWAAATVTMTASDAVGTSGFNYTSTWSDNTFAHPNANYSTGQYTLRTPASSNSFTFAGASLNVNNTNGIVGGLLYKGSGTTGLTTIKNLTVNGGYVRHASSSSDVFNLAGKVTLQGNATFDAAQGAIKIISDIDGSGSFTKAGGFTLQLTGRNTYTGDTFINAGSLRVSAVAPVASYTFDNVSGSTVVNAGSGSTAMNGTLANGATVVAGGQSGNAIQLSGGASVDIASGIVDLGPNKSWTVSAWVKTSTAGGSLLTKSDGTTWGGGNTIFYLGDGSAGGSGGIPSSVRYAGGFFQSAVGTPSVLNNAWHQITYVNNSGTYAIYVDGVLTTLSASNNHFANDDVGAVVRLGASTNTVAGDGTLNFNGLMDNVQFYNQALSAGQVSSLYQGNALLGTLPITTKVTIASGATLDLTGATQQIAGLSGVAGASVLMPNGQLIVNGTTNTAFAGAISGSAGTLTKSGPGTLSLTGSNSYTGGTTLTAGTLVIGNSARTPILSAGAAGIDVRGGVLTFDYTGGTSPASTVNTTLDAGFEQSTPFSSGLIRSTTLAADHMLGWTDDGTSVRVAITVAGDANLDFAVNFSDLLTLAANYGNTGMTWDDGDFNYDQTVNFTDLLSLAAHYGQSLTATQAETLGTDFAADFALAQSMVPEPMDVLGVALLGVGLRRTRCIQKPIRPNAN